MVAQVVQVDPQDDGGRGSGGIGNGAERGHQRRLAVVAAAAVIGRIGRVGQLVGDHFEVAEAQLGGQGSTVGELFWGERRGDGGDAQDAFGTEGVRCHLGHER